MAEIAALEIHGVQPMRNQQAAIARRLSEAHDVLLQALESAEKG